MMREVFGELASSCCLFFRIFCSGGSFHDHLSLSEDEPSLYIFSRVLQATG